MTQDEQIKALREDPRKARQLNVMLGVVDDAFRSNMATYIKLVQMDVMKEFNSRSDADGVRGERVEFSHGVMDPIMRQFDRDLEAQLMGQFKRLREKTGEGDGA